MIKQLSCPDYPHVVRRTFDIGFDKLAVYDLCKDCMNLPNFEDYIIKDEKLNSRCNLNTAAGETTQRESGVYNFD